MKKVKLNKEGYIEIEVDSGEIEAYIELKQNETIKGFWITNNTGKEIELKSVKLYNPVTKACILTYSEWSDKKLKRIKEFERSINEG